MIHLLKWKEFIQFPVDSNHGLFVRELKTRLLEVMFATSSKYLLFDVNQTLQYRDVPITLCK
jgi:hypothetical protein